MQKIRINMLYTRMETLVLMQIKHGITSREDLLKSYTKVIWQGERIFLFLGDLLTMQVLLGG